MYTEIEEKVENASEIYKGAEFLFNNITAIIIIGTILLTVIIIMLWNLNKRIKELQSDLKNLKQELYKMHSEAIKKTREP